MQTDEEILKNACREQFNAGEEMRFIGDTEQLSPVEGISVFDMAVLMAMQGYCQFSTTMPGYALIEVIAEASVKTAMETLIKSARYKERFFVKSNAEPEIDLPF